MARCWIDINLDAVLANYRAVKGLLQGASRCMAVVKADGYGLGAGEMALALEREGCTAFAVTTVAEGLVLRRYGVKGTILVLGPTFEDEWEEAVKADLQLTLTAAQPLQGLQKLCSGLDLQARVHIELETGMGRTGFSFDQLAQLADLLPECPNVVPEGIYTHFARAAQRDRAYTQRQFEAFKAGVAFLKERGIQPRYKHVCNSAAFLDYPEWHLDYVRVGTLLIGHYPGKGFAAKLKLTDPWSAKATVVHVQNVPKGTFVGYQSVYRTKRPTRLAVISVGYADGFGVEPHFVPQGWIDLGKIVVKNIAALFGKTLGREKITLRGRTVRVAGKIGMQLTVLDAGLGECRLGDEVEIPLRRTQANPCLCRRYWQSGELVGERDLLEQSFFAYKTFNAKKIMV